MARERRFLKLLAERQLKRMKKENPDASEVEVYEFALDDFEDRFAGRPFLKALLEILFDLFMSKVGG